MAWNGWREWTAALAVAAVAGPALAQDTVATGVPADAAEAEDVAEASVPGAAIVRGRVERADGPAGTALALVLEGGEPWQPCLVLLARAGEEPSLRDRPSYALPQTLDGQGAARIDLGDADAWAGAAALAVWSGPGGKLRGSLRVELSPPAPGPLGFQRGSVVVTEFMKDPSFVTDANGEWFEVYAPGPGRINLEGMTISDTGSNSHTINNNGLGLFVRPGKRIVLGNNNDTTTNGGVPVRYQYSSFTLGNGADSIIISHPAGQVMDRVDYDDGVLWPDSAGMSISLAPGMEDAVANDDPANWCHSVSPIGGGNPDTGTPRAANDVCP